MSLRSAATTGTGPHATGARSPWPGGAAGRRQQRRAAAHAFRPRRVLPSVVAAAVVAAAAILTVIETIAAAVGRPGYVLPVGSLTALPGASRFDDPLTIAIAVALCIVGLAAIVLAVRPGRPRTIALTAADSQTVIGMSRTALRRHLSAAATGVDGVTGARVQIGRRRIRVTATSPLHDTSGLASQVTDAVTDRLRELQPLRPLRVGSAVRRRPN